MKNKTEINHEVNRFSVAINVSEENGHFALSSILRGKTEGLEWAMDNLDTELINCELLRLYGILGDTRYVEHTNEILSQREESLRIIKSLEWIKED